MIETEILLGHTERGTYCLTCQSKCKWPVDGRTTKARTTKTDTVGRKTVLITKPPAGSDFTKEEMVAIRGFFEEWKREHGVSKRGMLGHSTFRTALGRLTNEHGYSLTDVGIFLGVSRERVRQWVNSAGIPAKRGAQKRIWNDDQNRFVTVDSTAEYDRIVRDRSTVLAYDDRRKKRRRIARWILIELGEDLGRVPGHVDLADAFGIKAPWLNGLLGIQRKEGYDLLWRKAGYPERPQYHRGGLGRPDRRHKTHDRHRATT